MKTNEMLDVAIQIAIEAHAGQFDRGGQPYILHCLKVMHYTKSTDHEVLAIAVLHDSVEDNKKITYEMLRERGLSERIVEGVRCMTRLPGQTQKEYEDQVMSNDDSIIVKKADLRHNSDIRRLKGVTDKDLARIAKYQKFYLLLENFHD